jgi:hypothetical protein
MLVVPDPIAYGSLLPPSSDYVVSVAPLHAHAAQAATRAVRPSGMDLRAEVRLLPGAAVDWRGAPEYQAFTDPSGGSGRDAFTLAVAHAAGGTLRANFTHHPHRADRAKTSGMTESCPRHPQE